LLVQSELPVVFVGGKPAEAAVKKAIQKLFPRHYTDAQWEDKDFSCTGGYRWRGLALGYPEDGMALDFCNAEGRQSHVVFFFHPSVSVYDQVLKLVTTHHHFTTLMRECEKRRGDGPLGPSCKVKPPNGEERSLLAYYQYTRANPVGGITPTSICQNYMMSGRRENVRGKCSALLN